MPIAAIKEAPKAIRGVSGNEASERQRGPPVAHQEADSGYGQDKVRPKSEVADGRDDAGVIGKTDRKQRQYFRLLAIGDPDHESGAPEQHYAIDLRALDDLQR